MHPLFLPSERPSERPSFRYFRQFAEQLIPVSRGFLGMDTSCKILARSLEGGDRTEIRNKFTMMSNECVSIKGTIATASGGPHEESVEQMLDAFFKSLSEEERKGVLVYLDKPLTEGGLIRLKLGLRGDVAVFSVDPTSIVMITNKADSDAAVQELRASNKPVAVDTENVYDPANMGRTNSAACIAQLCVDESKCFIFHFKSFDSDTDLDAFTALMADNTVKKVAHAAGHDKSSLKKRFTSLQCTNFVELNSQIHPSIKQASLNNKLGSLVIAGLSRRLKGKDTFDHSQWDNGVLTDEQKQYAAADAVAMVALMNAGPVILPIAQTKVDDAVVDAVNTALGLSGGGGEEEEEEEDEVEEEGGAEGGEEAAGTGLFDACVSMVQAYAKEARTTALTLPSGLDSSQRKAIHRICEDNSLHSHSCGDTASDGGAERRLVVEKRRPYTALIATVGPAATGYLVDDGEGRRGFVQTYLPKTGEKNTENTWLVVWDTEVNVRGVQRRKSAAAVSSVSARSEIKMIHKEERMEIDRLNQCIKNRWNADGGAGREPAEADAEAEALGGDEEHPLLKEMLDGIDKDWDTGDWCQIKYDLFHHLGVWAKATSADKKSLLFKTFMIALADTYSKLLLGEMERTLAHCIRSGMTTNRIGKLRRTCVDGMIRANSPTVCMCVTIV